MQLREEFAHRGTRPGMCTAKFHEIVHKNSDGGHAHGSRFWNQSEGQSITHT